MYGICTGSLRGQTGLNSDFVGFSYILAAMILMVSPADAAGGAINAHLAALSSGVHNSRPIGMNPKTASRRFTVKEIQEARRKCAIANPTIPRDGVRMNDLIHEELRKQNS
jgi:hypothetical protein